MRTEELLRRAYAAFNERHIEDALSVLAFEVEWANGMEGGHVHGREAVREYWLGQWKVIDPHVEPIAFLQSNERTVVTVHQIVKDLEGHTIIDQTVYHCYIVADGLIQRMDIVNGPSPTE